MPLFRQLWLAVILITLVSFLGSFAVSMLTASRHLEQQLHQKNVHDARFIALTISQLSKDPATIGLPITALFDSGQYSTISITSPDGQTIAERVQDAADNHAVPEWFVDLFSIHAEAGRAPVLEGWMHFGVIKVAGLPHLAQQALWDQAKALMLWFLVAGVLACIAGMLILYRIKRPLAAMVEQANDITERRFLTISEPHIPELRMIARATNDMIRRLHNRFFEETARLEALHRKLNCDAMTGLPNRKLFMNRGNSLLHEENAPVEGTLLLIRLDDLGQLNRKFDRLLTNNLLRQVGALIGKISGEDPDRLAARITASEFALMIPGKSDGARIAHRLLMDLTALFPAACNRTGGICHIGAVRYQHGARLNTVLAEADAALKAAASDACCQGLQAEIDSHAGNTSSWNHDLAIAIAAGRLKFTTFPVIDNCGQPMHREAAARLQLQQDTDWLAGRDFLPTASRFGVTSLVDAEMVRQAIDFMHRESGEIAINLSAESLGNKDCFQASTEFLRHHPEFCQRLWLEVSEDEAFRYFSIFKSFCHVFKGLGCKIGLDHFNLHFGEMQKLAEVGLDYLKIDSVFASGINQDKGRQKLLRGLCGFAHSVDIKIIAAGVQTEAERKTLVRLGFDGMTGPAVT